MKFARGQNILMLDADGATEISEYANLFKIKDSIQNANGEAFVAGSRNVVTEMNKNAEVFSN